MTPEELQVIRERAHKATPGPWSPRVNHPFMCDSVTHDGNEIVIVPDMPEYDSAADAEFIAHSREEVPKLLDEVERLRSALEEIRDNPAASEMYETAQEIANQALEES